MIEVGALRALLSGDLALDRARMRLVGDQSGTVMIDIAGPLVKGDYAAIGDAIEMAVDDPGCPAIVLRIDSPGGTVAGAFELADRIYEARKAKPIYAVADGAAHSAAYLIASQATEVLMTRTGSVGSIGVRVAHTDMSEALAQAGIRVTIITSGSHKADGSPTQPLSASARAAIQEQVDTFAQMFFDAVARGRGIPARAVADLEAGVFVGEDLPVRYRLIDGVMTLDEVLELAAYQTPGGAHMATEPAPEVEEAVPAPELEAQTPELPDLDAVRQEAMLDERARILSLESAADGRPHLAGLVRRAKAEGMTLEAFKIAAFDVKPDPAAAYLAGVEADSPDAVADAVVEQTAPKPGELKAGMSREEQARILWDANAELRNKYLDRFETFLHSEDLDERMVG